MRLPGATRPAGWPIGANCATGVVHVRRCYVNRAGCVVELGHELAVGRAGGGFLVVFFELEARVYNLLLQVGDLLGEGADVGGGAEPGLVPGLLAERFGQAVFELLDAGGEPDRAFVGGEQVCLQGGAGDWAAPRFPDS